MPRLAAHEFPDREETTRKRLLRRYARWRRAEDLEALVISYRPLARALARRYAASSCTRDDLEQAACEGLIKAIRRFEPDRGTSFPSFAVPTVLGELRRFLRDTSWPAHVPRSLQERVREVRSAAEDFRAVHGRAATVRELAASLGCEEEAVLEAIGVTASLNVVPLDRPSQYGDATTMSVAEHVGFDDPGYERIECLAAIEDALPTLPSGHKAILRLHFAEDMTQRQIAGRLGVSRSEVARNLSDAVARLRAATAEQQAA
jgi:RNA polymerase sigma-B factor